MTLTEFLLARIAEDEASAPSHNYSTVIGEHEGNALMGWVRFNPDRVLAECEAKRRIVEHRAHWNRTLHETPDGWTETGCTAYRMAMEWTARLLTLPYADHEDYDPAWRPDDVVC